jgi:hypothetical protein
MHGHMNAKKTFHNVQQSDIYTNITLHLYWRSLW